MNEARRSGDGSMQKRLCSEVVGMVHTMPRISKIIATRISMAMGSVGAVGDSRARQCTELPAAPSPEPGRDW